MRQVFLVGLSMLVGSSLPAQVPATIEIVRQPSTIVQVGELFNAPAIVRVLAADGTPVRSVQVRIAVTSGGGWMEGDDPVTTGADGVAVFDELELYGPVGDRILQFSTGAALSRLVPVTVSSGFPATLEVERQPSNAVQGDATFSTQPRVVVRDAGRNPLSRIPVTAKLTNVSGDSTAQLLGVTTALTNEGGVAEFSDLAISGREGVWQIEFSVPSYTIWGCDNPETAPEPCRFGKVKTESQRITYDPDFSMDKSYVVVSLIKSIAGERPENEFFDIRFRFRISRSVFVLSNIDAALSNRGTDSISTDDKKLTEASLSFNFSPRSWTRRTPNDVPQRTVYAGFMAKVFNTLPYAGVTLGGVELGGSDFYGTATSLSLLHRLSEAPLITAQADTLRPERFNLFFEFYVRSSAVDFFKTFSLRGGILLPMVKNGEIQSRIAVSVPIGTIGDF